MQLFMHFATIQIRLTEQHESEAGFHKDKCKDVKLLPTLLPIPLPDTPAARRHAVRQAPHAASGPLSPGRILVVYRVVERLGDHDDSHQGTIRQRPDHKGGRAMFYCLSPSIPKNDIF